ncbi:MAG TPA: HEAT repeat domain-containing protein [Thermoanaerobaculia bacterium]
METVGHQAPSWDECVEILERLPAMPLDTRVEALERLVRNPSPGIREQALRIGASVLPDSRLTEYLREPADAALRNAGSEILKLRGGRSLPLVIRLLQDPDPDVVLQAVLILDRLRDPRALEPLHAVLSHPDPNVQQEAIVAIGHLGDARSIPHLLPFLTSDLWVQMAAVQALGDLRSPEAVPHLADRLTDPLVGSLAAEALARVGGEPAFHALAFCWPAGGVEIDDETMLGLLAHVLEGVPRPEEIGPLPRGFREALSARLHDRSAEVSTAAARCLLALGASPWDGAAIEVLAGSRPAPALRPAALARRHDLIPTLLGGGAREPRAWGFQLAASFPEQVPTEPFLAALRETAERLELMPHLLQALQKVRVPGLGEALLALFLELPAGSRDLLVPALGTHGDEVRAALDARTEVSEADRLVLEALLGKPVDEVAQAVLDIDPSFRPGVISRLMRIDGLVTLLPWDDWLEEAPELYSALAAEAAVRCGLSEMLPNLRARAAVMPSVPLIRALGALGDREAVPVLAACLEAAEDLRATILESLGRIGGPEARAVLSSVVLSLGASPEARTAFRALAACAGPGDDVLFRAAAVHPDWQVRLVAADVLGRFGRSENSIVLTRLAADPVPAVSHRALAALES